MGLWYSNDTGIALSADANVDHVGCQDTRRSTSGSAQFLGDSLTVGLKESKEHCLSIVQRINTLLLSRCCAKSYG
ncbi:hypothetical protein Tco_1384540 [Tanacetum coccineum]